MKNRQAAAIPEKVMLSHAKTCSFFTSEVKSEKY
jgi:hypothetical protein